MKVKSSMARSFPVENLLPQNVVFNYQQLAVMLLKKPNGELPVAVDPSQLRTMASETVVLRFLPTQHNAITPELHVLHGVNAVYKSQDLLQQPCS